jgi:hypothetical protein
MELASDILEAAEFLRLDNGFYSAVMDGMTLTEYLNLVQFLVRLPNGEAYIFSLANADTQLIYTTAVTTLGIVEYANVIDLLASIPSCRSSQEKLANAFLGTLSDETSLKVSLPQAIMAVDVLGIQRWDNSGISTKAFSLAFLKLRENLHPGRNGRDEMFKRIFQYAPVRSVLVVCENLDIYQMSTEELVIIMQRDLDLLVKDNILLRCAENGELFGAENTAAAVRVIKVLEKLDDSSFNVTNFDLFAGHWYEFARPIEDENVKGEFLGMMAKQIVEPKKEPQEQPNFPHASEAVDPLIWNNLIHLLSTHCPNLSWNLISRNNGSGSSEARLQVLRQDYEDSALFVLTESALFMMLHHRLYQPNVYQIWTEAQLSPSDYGIRVNIMKECSLNIPEREFESPVVDGRSFDLVAGIIDDRPSGLSMSCYDWTGDHTLTFDFNPLVAEAYSIVE